MFIDETTIPTVLERLAPVKVALSSVNSVSLFSDVIELISALLVLPHRVS